MAIESVVKTSSTPMNKFPRIMKSSNSLAVFLVVSIEGEYFSGTVISGQTKGGLGVGHTNIRFTGANCLFDLDGTVTLSNL
jgi:hypothetical protein